MKCYEINEMAQRIVVPKTMTNSYRDDDNRSRSCLESWALDDAVGKKVLSGNRVDGACVPLKAVGVMVGE
jgi:hypothetical protein